MVDDGLVIGEWGPLAGSFSDVASNYGEVARPPTPLLEKNLDLSRQQTGQNRGVSRGRTDYTRLHQGASIPEPLVSMLTS